MTKTEFRARLDRIAHTMLDSIGTILDTVERSLAPVPAGPPHPRRSCGFCRPLALGQRPVRLLEIVRQPALPPPATRVRLLPPLGRGQTTSSVFEICAPGGGAAARASLAATRAPASPAIC